MTDLANVPAAAPAAAPAGSPIAAGPGPTDPPADLGPVRETVRGLLRRGLAPPEAGNLAALTVGLRPARDGWTVRQIEHLRFLRAIVRDGLLDP